MPARKNVVIGFLGIIKDIGADADRWGAYRPTVCLCQHDALPIHRLELIVQPSFKELGERVLADVRKVSPKTIARAQMMELKDPWDFQEVYGALYDFARGYPFNPDTEEYLLHMSTGTHAMQTCFFLLAESRLIPGKLVQSEPPPKGQRGGEGYRIIDLDLARYDQIAKRFRQDHRDARAFLKSGIATRNAAFNKLMERVEQVALSSDAPILLLGPTGAGKSQLARRIYELKKARHLIRGAFVELNCATVRGDAARSALFGHVKGAFTGATHDRHGLLCAADGGIVFLDEVGELGADEQAMLLRALEEKIFLPVGSDREVTSSFQLLAGTNRDLHASVADGHFREDLLTRIHLWTFRLPSLRERPEDIEPNLSYELEQYARRTGTHASFNAEARKRFLDFAVSREAQWKGNFRDLNGAIYRMATLAEGGRITPEVVDEEIARLKASWRRTADGASDESAPAGSDDELLTKWLGAKEADRLDHFERVQLAEVLRVCLASETLSDAGRKLFNRSREEKKTVNDADRLRKYLERYELGWARLKAE